MSENEETKVEEEVPKQELSLILPKNLLGALLGLLLGSSGATGVNLLWGQRSLSPEDITKIEVIVKDALDERDALYQERSNAQQLAFELKLQGAVREALVEHEKEYHPTK